MAKVYEFLADGFEDVEALAPLDVLRRGGVEVVTVSIMGRREVTSAHQVTVVADTTIEEVGSMSDADLLLLPGGMPGAANLHDHSGVADALLRHAAGGKATAAICAAPMVLGSLGLLHGRRATCYPGFEKYLDGATYTAEKVTVDMPFVTAFGPAAAFDFGFTLLGLFTDSTTVGQLRKGMMFEA